MWWSKLGIHKLWVWSLVAKWDIGIDQMALPHLRVRPYIQHWDWVQLHTRALWCAGYGISTFYTSHLIFKNQVLIIFPNSHWQHQMLQRPTHFVLSPFWLVAAFLRYHIVDTPHVHSILFGKWYWIWPHVIRLCILLEPDGDLFSLPVTMLSLENILMFG